MGFGVWQKRGELDLAIEQNLEGVAIFETILASKNLKLARALNSMGCLYDENKNIEDAAVMYERALEIWG